MDYTAAAARASAKIKAKGQPATLSRSVALGYDPNLTVSVDAVGLTFTRSSGSWLTDGFAVGASVTFGGFVNAGNNAAFVASAVTDLVLTCSTATGLVTEPLVYNVMASAITSFACDVLEQDVNGLRVFADSLVPGSLISESNRFFMLAGASPKTSDKLTIGAIEHTVESARPMSPGATVLYWTVRVRA